MRLLRGLPGVDVRVVADPKLREAAAQPHAGSAAADGEAGAVSESTAGGA